MSSTQIQLLGPYDAWHAAAHRALVELEPGKPREALVLLGPEQVGSDALERARRQAAVGLRVRHPSVLSLLAVESLGERVAWVYEDVDAFGLWHNIGAPSEFLLPTRTAAEVVAMVAEALIDLGADGHAHPGPEAADILLTTTGEIRLAGFSGPFPPPPVMHAPQGEEGGMALVYRLGVLLAQLVSGATPSPSTDRAAHNAVIRRALIRTMSRPGPVFSERYGDWLGGMLAWDPAERPPLSRVPAGLRKVAATTAGPDLFEWCARDMEAARRRVVRDADSRRAHDGSIEGEPPGISTLEREVSTADVVRRTAVPPSPPPASRRESGITTVDLPPIDETTQESLVVEPVEVTPARSRGTSLEEPELVDSKPPIRVSSLVPMPVKVGPPPELARSRPSLPPGFLDQDRLWSDDPVSGLAEPWWVRTQTLWIAGGLLGGLAIVLLAINLALWMRTVQAQDAADEPRSIASIMEEAPLAPDDDGRTFALVFEGPKSARITVDCAGRTAGGIGYVEIGGVSPGRCRVSSVWRGETVVTDVVASAPRSYACFREGALLCQ